MRMHVQAESAALAETPEMKKTQGRESRLTHCCQSPHIRREKKPVAGVYR